VGVDPSGTAANKILDLDELNNKAKNVDKCNFAESYPWSEARVKCP
jgi:hypothetical protein